MGFYNKTSVIILSSSSLFLLSGDNCDIFIFPFSPYYAGFLQTENYWLAACRQDFIVDKIQRLWVQYPGGWRFYSSGSHMSVGMEWKLKWCVCNVPMFAELLYVSGYRQWIWRSCLSQSVAIINTWQSRHTQLSKQVQQSVVHRNRGQNRGIEDKKKCWR